MEATARLRNYPTSPRKMRLLIDLIRGEDVEKALNILKFSPKHNSRALEKLVFSAIDNWKQKNETEEVEGLYVKTAFVDQAGMLKRIQPAPQGRAHRIRKRSNHVTIIVDKK